MHRGRTRASGMVARDPNLIGECGFRAWIDDLRIGSRPRERAIAEAMVQRSRLRTLSAFSSRNSRRGSTDRPEDHRARQGRRLAPVRDPRHRVTDPAMTSPVNTPVPRPVVGPWTPASCRLSGRSRRPHPPPRQLRHLGDRHVHDPRIVRRHRLELDDLLGLQRLLAHLLSDRPQPLDLLLAEAAGIHDQRLGPVARTVAVHDLVDRVLQRIQVALLGIHRGLSELLGVHLTEAPGVLRWCRGTTRAGSCVRSNSCT